MSQVLCLRDKVEHTDSLFSPRIGKSYYDDLPLGRKCLRASNYCSQTEWHPDPLEARQFFTLSVIFSA